MGDDMSERYIKVFTGSENLYLEGAPIIIRANVLLKDTQTGKVLAQCKFQNLSGKSISCVKVAITQLDAFKNPLDKDISFEYLDLSVSDGEVFGSKKPLPLPNSSARAFCVGVSHVRFTDGTFWTSNDLDWKSVADDSAAFKAVAIADAYKQAVTLASENEEDIKKAKEILEGISESKDVSAAMQNCEEKLAGMEIEKTKKKKKITKMISFIAGGLIAACLLFVFVVRPLRGYFAGDYAVFIKTYQIKNFKIPDGVTKIEDFEFSGYDSLTSIAIPDSVTSIGESAFSGSGLTSIVIPDSVTSIGEGAFYGCDKLQSVTLGNGVTRINSCVFEGCSSLKSIVIPDGVTSIGDGAFSGSGLTSIVIPDSVTNIGIGAFKGCGSLTSITLPFVGNVLNGASNTHFGYIFGASSRYEKHVPASLKTVVITGGSNIDDYAFYCCRSLTSIVLPDSVTSIGEHAFMWCSSLTNVTIPDSVTSIGYSAFYDCSSLTSVTIPDSVTSMDHVFYVCSSLMNITVSSNNQNYASIDGVLFNKAITDLFSYPCGKTGAYTIPNSVTNIDDHAFYDCSSLTSIVIPDSVTSIGRFSFSFCSNLTSIQFTGTTAQWNAISKDFGWNDDVPATKVVCSDGEVYF